MGQQIPRPFIDELLARADIVQVVESLLPSGALKKKGANYVACCPFHQEKTASFTISPSKQIYHCFGCGVSGNAIGFLMDYQKLSFVESIEMLATRFGMVIPREATAYSAPTTDRSALYAMMDRVTRYYQNLLNKHARGQQALAYLKSRGLNATTIQQFSLGYAPPGWTNLVDQAGKDPQTRQLLQNLGLVIHDAQKKTAYDRFRDRIIYPIRDRQGRVIGFGGRVLGEGEPKYLNSPETSLFQKGSELYGLYEARKVSPQMKRLLVVEGYMDVIMLFQAGFPYTVATMGTATTPANIEKMFRLVPEVVFCFDGDAAGRTAAWRALETVLPVMRDHWQVKFMFLPEGEDPDTLVMKEGKAAFEERIRKAVPLSRFFFHQLKTHAQQKRIEDRVQLVDLGVSYLEKMPANVTRDMLLQELAKSTGMELSQIHRYLNSADSVTAPSIAPSSTMLSLSEKVLALLLQYPTLVSQITAPLTSTPLAEIHLLEELLEHLTRNPNVSTAVLIEHFREHEKFDYLMSLAYRELHISEQAAPSEFEGLLHQLRRQAIEKEIEHWMTKASISGLQPDEKQRLKELLEEKQKI